MNVAHLAEDWIIKSFLLRGDTQVVNAVGDPDSRTPNRHMIKIKEENKYKNGCKKSYTPV